MARLICDSEHPVVQRDRPHGGLVLATLLRLEVLCHEVRGQTVQSSAGPDPLIRKRDGCHRWEPVEFGPDDPRHGWTWDHCWKDAAALLGSEDAVRKYVEGKHEKPEQPDGIDVSKDTLDACLLPEGGAPY